MKGNWIKESEAAERCGYATTPDGLDRFRRNVKSGKLDISYTTLNGKKYQYCLNSIEKLLNKKAVFV
jgi:hypothetical protein